MIPMTLVSTQPGWYTNSYWYAARSTSIPGLELVGEFEMEVLRRTLAAVVGDGTQRTARRMDRIRVEQQSSLTRRSALRLTGEWGT